MRYICTRDGSYNMTFDEKTGKMERWGKTLEDDPTMCPIGPEILDIEVSTICTKGCKFCYKGNTGAGKNMDIKKFMSVFAKLPKSLTQIAFGIGDVGSNPDLFDIMGYCRIKGVVPNITVNGHNISDDQIYRLANTCGAVAVSHYNDEDCFGTVSRLSKAGLKQVNIHQLLSKETFSDCLELIRKAKVDDRLVGKLRAIVFLLLKPKGPRNTLHPVTMGQYQELIDLALKEKVSVGMDSCSAPMALKAFPARVRQMIEPCESGLFSFYINVDGMAFPCSFSEGTPGWEVGIDVEKCKSFDDIWYSDRVNAWRKRLNVTPTCKGCECSKLCRKCQVYDVTLCEEK
jgi:radical SAM protein with 4Fe4S-binding SPASM domain